MKKFLKYLAYVLVVAILLIFSAFAMPPLFGDEAGYLQKKLQEHYDGSQEGSDISGYELQVTNTGFCRYKRLFATGKVEYFSFNILKYKRLDYDGIPENGRLYLRTLSDDVIVQTHHDQEGDVDSMATYLAIPLKDMQKADLEDLAEHFQLLNLQLASQR